MRIRMRQTKEGGKAHVCQKNRSVKTKQKTKRKEKKRREQKRKQLRYLHSNLPVPLQRYSELCHTNARFVSKKFSVCLSVCLSLSLSLSLTLSASLFCVCCVRLSPFFPQFRAKSDFGCDLNDSNRTIFRARSDLFIFFRYSDPTKKMMGRFMERTKESEGETESGLWTTTCGMPSVGWLTDAA